MEGCEFVRLMQFLHLMFSIFQEMRDLSLTVGLLLSFCCIGIDIEGSGQISSVIQEKATITFNEINVISSESMQQFIELRYSDHCLFRRSLAMDDQGPSLRGFLIVQLDGNGRLYNFLDLRSYSFSNNSGFFVISERIGNFIYKPPQHNQVRF